MDDPVDEVEVARCAALAHVVLEGGEVAVMPVGHRDERSRRDELEDDAGEDRQRAVGAVEHVEQLVLRTERPALARAGPDLVPPAPAPSSSRGGGGGTPPYLYDIDSTEQPATAPPRVMPSSSGTTLGSSP